MTDNLWTEIGIPGGIIVTLIGVLGFYMRSVIKKLDGTMQAILTGELIPRSVHEDVRTDRDAWKAAAITSDARGDELARQLTPILEGVKTMASVLESIKADSHGSR